MKVLLRSRILICSTKTVFLYLVMLFTNANYFIIGTVVKQTAFLRSRLLTRCSANDTINITESKIVDLLENIRDIYFLYITVLSNGFIRE